MSIIKYQKEGRGGKALSHDMVPEEIELCPMNLDLQNCEPKYTSLIPQQVAPGVLLWQHKAD